MAKKDSTLTSTSGAEDVTYNLETVDDLPIFPKIEQKKYSFGKGLMKGVISIMVFALPFFITNFPDVANITIGGMLTMLVNMLKTKYGK